MTIIYYSPHPNIHLHTPAGPGVHIREVIRAMEAEGHTVVPVIMGGTEETDTAHQGSEPQQKGIKGKLKALLPNLVWQTAKDLLLFRFDKYAQGELKLAIEKHQPDLIYERAYYGMTSGVNEAKRAGVTHFLEMNAPYPEERIDMEGRSLFSVRARRAERKQFRLSSRIIVVSSALRDYVIRRFPAAAEKTIVTPNAVRDDLVLPGQDEISNLRKELKIGNESRVVGFVGSIFPYHGVDRLIEAFAQVHAELPTTRLLIVGGGAMLDELKDMSKLMGIEDACIFTGKIAHDQVYRYIGVMDITVMATSNWYGSPVKIFEYGIMGKPIIAPNVIPVTDVMESGKHGILIPPSVDQLRQALETMLKHKDLRLEMAEAFRKEVAERYTWRKIVRMILSGTSVDRSI